MEDLNNLYNVALTLYNNGKQKESLDILLILIEHVNSPQINNLICQIYLLFESYDNALAVINYNLIYEKNNNNYLLKYHILKKINSIDLFDDFIDELNYFTNQNENTCEQICDLIIKVKSHIPFYSKDVMTSIINNNLSNNTDKILKLKEWILNSYFVKLGEYSNLVNIKKHKILLNPKEEFRYFCYNMIDLIKRINLPLIKNHSIYEAVLVEFRIIPHLEFIIRNAILKLGKEWAHTIICGNLNYDWIQNICLEIYPNNLIKIIKLDIDNLSTNKYNELLARLDFWEKLNGDKILIHQEDSIIFKSNYDDFINWDYIGAPWPPSSNINPNNVGNGGFSLRSKIKMIEIINKINIMDVKYNVNYDGIPPEDVYFTKIMNENNIGILADTKSALEFSHEYLINENAFGGHCFFIYNNNWKNILLKNNVYSLLEKII